MSQLPLALVISGPTGVGKSALALQLAQQLPLEIISVDSAQVYRGLDIGTAKPDLATRRAIAHHLIDIRDASESYSAGGFVTDVAQLVRDIAARGRLPVLVGGTMLYFRALFGGLAAMPQANPEIRRQLDARAARDGWPTLHAELARIDPQAAARIHPNDPQRIQRALEVHAISGSSISALQAQTRAAPVADLLPVALLTDSRSALHARNLQRLEAMMSAGFLEEVRALRARGDLTATSNAVRAVGYRQLWQHLDGDFTLDEAVRRIQAATRKLVKRQLTWINGDARWLRLDAQAPQRCDILRKHVDEAQLRRG